MKSIKIVKISALSYNPLLQHSFKFNLCANKIRYTPLELLAHYRRHAKSQLLQTQGHPEVVTLLSFN